MTKHLFSALLLWLGCHLTALAADEVLIDVRSAEEFAAGHLEGALLMPHDQIGPLIAKAGIGRDTPITLYCRSGRRAEAAQQTLQNLGYTRVSNAGGYEQLVRQGADSCEPAGAC